MFVEERPAEWIEGFTDYYLNQGYGFANNLRGFEGVLEVLEERGKLENSIYNSLKLKKYKIDNNAFKLNSTKEEVKFVVEVHF